MTLQDLKILVELQVVVVFLIDLSGAIEHFKGWLKRWLNIRGEVSIRPFDCSLCTYHWTALIVLLCMGKLTLFAYMVVCLLALATTITRDLIVFIYDKVIWLLKK